MDDDEDTRLVTVDDTLWETASDEAGRWERRGATARFVAKVIAIGVSLVALLATFVGLPEVAGFSVLLVSVFAVYAFIEWGQPLVQPREASALDGVADVLAAAWDVEVGRGEIARLVLGGRILGSHWQVRRTDDAERVVLQHEHVTPEPEVPWASGF